MYIYIYNIHKDIYTHTLNSCMCIYMYIHTYIIYDLIECPLVAYTTLSPLASISRPCSRSRRRSFSRSSSRATAATAASRDMVG